MLNPTSLNPNYSQEVKNVIRYYSSAYPVYASSNGIAYEIYLAGCRGYCVGCHSPHTHDKNLGTPMEEVLDKLYDSIDKWYNRGFIDNLVILGGEPLDNSDLELKEFLNNLKIRYPNCKLWLYTHFEIDEVRRTHPETLKVLDFIKCGKFEQDKFSEEGFRDSSTGVILATSNQYIINLKEDNHV